MLIGLPFYEAAAIGGPRLRQPNSCIDALALINLLVRQAEGHDRLAWELLANRRGVELVSLKRHRAEVMVDRLPCE